MFGVLNIIFIWYVRQWVTTRRRRRKLERVAWRKAQVKTARSGLSDQYGAKKMQSKHIFQFWCKWFLQVLFSLCHCPVYATLLKGKDFSESLPCFWRGGYVVFVRMHAELGRGNGRLCLSSVWLSLLDAGVSAVLCSWFSLWLSAVYFPKATWELSSGFFSKSGPGQTILQFDTV